MRDMKRDVGQVGNRNRLVAIVAAAITFFAVLIWGVPGIDPSLWDEVAVVAGVRPPHGIFPGFWRVLAGGLFALLGANAATAVLPFFGALVAAVCSYLVCLITRQALALLIRTAKPYPVWYRRIAPFFSFVAAVLFGISDPIFRVAQVFSPDELRLVMFLSCIHLGLRWFVVGGRWRLFPLMALMGLLAAETPFGFILPLAFIGSYAAVWFCIMDNLFAKPDALAEPSELPKWRMFFLFLGGLALGVVINAQSFIGFGGAEACGMKQSIVYFRYGVGYWAMLKGAASIIGWVLGLGFCVIPFVVAARIFPAVVRDDQPMPFGRGALLFFVGMLAVLQSGAIGPTRFWTFSTEYALVRSGFLMTFFIVCAVEAIALFGAAFAFECQRTYLTFEDENDQIKGPGVLLRYLSPAIAAIIVVAAFISVPKTTECEMQRIVDAAIEETLDECGGAKWLFTDGRLDTGIELAAARRGSPLRTLNMMSGASDWEVFVRSRGFEAGSEDEKMAKTGIPALLRVWAGEKVNGMEGVAIQLGFEFWKREQKPLPTLSGMIAMEKGLDKAAAEKGIARAKELSERILAISPKVESTAIPSSALASAFSAVNWRLSRFAHMREDHEVANGLDQANSALRRMLSAIEYERQRTFMQLTPREGLEIALRRSNFVEAQRYSAAVLKNDSDDPQANFAMGMSAIMDKRYKDAELYLTRVLKRRPKEPAALNNLSIVCRKLRKYELAESYARQAIEILPNSPEVINTLNDAIKKAP